MVAPMPKYLSTALLMAAWRHVEHFGAQITPKQGPKKGWNMLESGQKHLLKAPYNPHSLGCQQRLKHAEQTPHLHHLSTVAAFFHWCDKCSLWRHQVWRPDFLDRRQGRSTGLKAWRKWRGPIQCQTIDTFLRSEQDMERFWWFKGGWSCGQELSLSDACFEEGTSSHFLPCTRQGPQ